MGTIQVCTGSSNEMITPGGEVQFVSRMIVESLEIGSRIRSVVSSPSSNLLTRRIQWGRSRRLIRPGVQQLVLKSARQTFFRRQDYRTTPATQGFLHPFVKLRTLLTSRR